MLTASHWPLLTWVYIMLTGWLHARRGAIKNIKIKIKIRICTYVYFSLDLLALGALTPALILTLQVVLKYYQGLHEIQSCTCTAGFFLCYLVVLIKIIWRCLHKVRCCKGHWRDGTDYLPRMAVLCSSGQWNANCDLLLHYQLSIHRERTRSSEEENQNTTRPGQKLVTLPSPQPLIIDPSLESGLSPLNSRLETGQAVKLMIGRHMDDDDDDAQKEINQFDSRFEWTFFYVQT